MGRTSRTILLIIVASALGFGAGLMFFKKKESESRSSRAVLAIEDIAQFALVEVAISKIFEIQKENLKLGFFDVPFTSQQSLISAEGRAKLGYDLSQIKIVKNASGIDVTVGASSLIALDVSYRFISENDTWLNRISPADRNSILENVRVQLRKEAESAHLATLCFERLETALKKVSGLMGIVINLSSEF